MEGKGGRIWRSGREERRCLILSRHPHLILFRLSGSCARAIIVELFKCDLTSNTLALLLSLRAVSSVWKALRTLHVATFAKIAVFVFHEKIVISQHL